MKNWWSFKLRIADFRVLYENTFYHPRWLKIRDTDFVVSLLEAEFWFFTIFQVTQTEAIRSFIDEHFARVQKQSTTIYPCLASEAFHLGVEENLFRVLLFEIILMQEAISDAKYA